MNTPVVCVMLQSEGRFRQPVFMHIVSLHIENLSGNFKNVKKLLKHDKTMRIWSIYKSRMRQSAMETCLLNKT